MIGEEQTKSNKINPQALQHVSQIYGIDPFDGEYYSNIKLHVNLSNKRPILFPLFSEYKEQKYGFTVGPDQDALNVGRSTSLTRPWPNDPENFELAFSFTNIQLT